MTVPAPEADGMYFYFPPDDMTAWLASIRNQLTDNPEGSDRA